MCGAFSIRLNPWERSEIKASEVPRTWKPIYNARPGEWLPIVTQEAPKTITLALWSFIPHWSKDPKSRGVINARSESVAEKPYFRSAFQSHRCLIPADGFFEWTKSGKTRTPYYFHRIDDRPFAFAGLYSHLPGTDKIGFALLTTTPNHLVEMFHDRMPVMLEVDAEKAWLNRDASASALEGLLRPYPVEMMAAYAVSRRVNSAREKGPEVLKRAA